MAQYNYQTGYPLNLEAGSTEKPLSAFQKVKAEFERLYRLLNSGLSTIDQLASQISSQIASIESLASSLRTQVQNALNTIDSKLSAQKTEIKNYVDGLLSDAGITGNCTITVVGGVQNNIGTFTGVQGRIYILDGNNVRYGNNTIKVAYGSTIIVAVVKIRTGDTTEDVVKKGYFPVEISFQKSALQVSMRDFFPSQSNIFNTNITSRLGLEDNAQATVSYAVHVTENITITGSAMVKTTTETGGGGGGH